MPLNRLFSLSLCRSFSPYPIYSLLCVPFACMNQLFVFASAHLAKLFCIFFRVEIFFSVVALYCHYCCCWLVYVYRTYDDRILIRTHIGSNNGENMRLNFFLSSRRYDTTSEWSKNKKKKKSSRAFVSESHSNAVGLWWWRHIRCEEEKNEPNIMIIIYEWIEKVCRPGRPVDLFAFGAGQFVKNSNSSCQCQWMISVLHECVRDHTTLRMLLVYFGNSFTYDVVRTSAFIRTVRMVKWFHVLYGGWWWWL